MICIAGTYRIKEGHEEEALGHMLEAQALSRSEPGMLSYQVHRSTTDPRLFLLFEQYQDEDAVKAHTRTDYFKRIIIGRVVPLIEERVSGTYLPVEG